MKIWSYVSDRMQATDASSPTCRPGPPRCPGKRSVVQVYRPSLCPSSLEGLCPELSLDLPGRKTPGTPNPGDKSTFTQHSGQ